MSAPRNNAWRFFHPDLDWGAPASGLQVDAAGCIAMVDGDASVRQSLLLLLTTVPGERVMRPAYGCHLDRLLFAVNDDTTAGLAMHYVRGAIAQWEPRVAVEHVDAFRHPEQPFLLVIRLHYRVRESQRVEQMEFALDLQGTTSDVVAPAQPG